MDILLFALNISFFNGASGQCRKERFGNGENDAMISRLLTVEVILIQDCVIPCYNESKRINHLLKTLKSFDSSWNLPFEVIIVDDGSSDKTAELIEKSFTNAFSDKVEFKNILRKIFEWTRYRVIECFNCLNHTEKNIGNFWHHFTHTMLIDKK